MEKQTAFVRLYVLDAYGIPGLDLDGNSDPYLKIKFGEKTLTGNKKINKSTKNPVFNEYFEFNCTFPGPSSLIINLFDYDLIGSDDFIGRTVIDIESRFFNKRYMSIPFNPIESRNLTCDETSSSRGIVRCWVDIVPEKKKDMIPTWCI